MVTGKGGVGKTLISAALAQELSNQGFKTLLVELDEKSTFQTIFEKKLSKSVGYEPTAVSKNFYLSAWSGEGCLKEYLGHLIKIKSLVHLFFENKIMKAFVRAAPALKELALLGKITSGVRHWGPELPFDRIVVDAYSTGHFLSLLKAPIGMSELISTGPMGEQSKNMIQVMKSKESVTYIVVTLLEDTPISESLELLEELKKWTGQEAHIVANKYFSLNDENVDISKLPNLSGSKLEWFYKQFKILNQRSTDGVSRLESKNATYIKVPMVFSLDNEDILSQIGQAIKRWAQ